MIHTGCILFVVGILVIVGIIKVVLSLFDSIDDLNTKLQEKKDENTRLCTKIYLLENK